MESTALYVHIPFCKSKCSYCDFFSVAPPLCAANAESSAKAARGEVDSRYIDSLLDEARERRRQFGVSAWKTVYIGGGTPSLLSPAQIEKLLRGLNAVCPIDSGAEITLECNPDDVTADFLRQVAGLGVNRLSLGLQAMDDAPLAAVNRRARRAENLRALELINKYWIDSPDGGFCGSGGAHNAAQGESGSTDAGNSAASAPHGNGLSGASDSLGDGLHGGGSFRAERSAPDGGSFACDGSLAAMHSSLRNLQSDNSFGEKRLHGEGSPSNDDSSYAERRAPDGSSFGHDGSISARRSRFRNSQSDNSFGEKHLHGEGSFSNADSPNVSSFANSGAINVGSSNAVPRSSAESPSGGANPCPQNGRPRRRFSVDLICGLPLQTRESFFAGLGEVLASGADHVSLYSLTLEEGTPLFRDVERGITELPQSQADIWWLAAREKLEQSGFALYEVSNFAKSGCQSAHNLAYWLMQPYVGIGAGATGTIGGFRYTNSRDIAGYMAKTAPAATERLGRDVQIFEFLMMGFRLRQGVDALEFERRFGEKLERYIQPAFGEWQKAGRAAVCGSRYALNLEGLSLLNRFLLEILP